MKFGVSTFLWTSPFSTNSFDLVYKVKEMGFDIIEIAVEKKELIDARKHLVLKAAHPSPLSAHNGFFGCRHFSKTNASLAGHLIDPVDWAI